MRLFDLACITLRRLLLSPDQNETWGEWVDTLMEATASEGDVELKQQLITVSKDICNIVRQFASASPSFTEGITDVMKGVAAHYIQRGAARRKPSPHFTASRPMGRLAIPSAVGRGSPGGSFLPPSPESIAPPEVFFLPCAEHTTRRETSTCMLPSLAPFPDAFGAAGLLADGSGRVSGSSVHTHHQRRL